MAISDADRELARQIVVTVLRDEEAAWDTVAQMVHDHRMTRADWAGKSQHPSAVWKRRKRELRQLASPVCSACMGRGIIVSEPSSGIRSPECRCVLSHSQ